MSFTATLMDVEIVMLSEDREGEILYDILYMQNLKGNDTNELFTKQKQTHRFREWTYGCQGWRMGVDRIGIWVPVDTLLYLKWITNKGLLHSIGNSAQHYVVAWIGRELGENGYMHMYGQIPLWSTWNYDNIVNQLYSKIKYKSFKKNYSTL